MARKEVFSCDRCGKEVRGPHLLRYFHSEVDNDIEKKSAGARGDLVGGEICTDCAGEMASAVHSAWENGVPR